MFAFTLGHISENAARDLGRLAAVIPSGTRELLEKAVDEIARPRIAANFERAGGSDPWQELAESTVERRNRPSGRGGDTLLVASGAGRDAATARARWTITRDEAAYPAGGWSAPGAQIRYHQEGTRDGHVPARPFGRLEAADAAKLDRVGLAWLDTRLRGAGW